VKGIVDTHFIDIVISTQVLGEFFNVLVKKIGKRKEEAREMAVNLLRTFEITEIKKTSVLKATEVSIKYKYSYWDSLIVASALEANCSILYTEDMQNGQIIEDRLRIVNLFAIK
jgi:predicted nucleic acid-binding protein